MNNKLDLLITDFMNSIGEYLHMEYKPIYYKEYTSDKNLSALFEFVGSYYMGGSNVPDTARYVVEYIQRFILGSK
jgi:hypothetical protein